MTAPTEDEVQKAFRLLKHEMGCDPVLRDEVDAAFRVVGEALDEARKDKARLDWLDSKEEVSVGHLMDDEFRGIRYVDSGRWVSGPTVRAAIDQARGA